MKKRLVSFLLSALMFFNPFCMAIATQNVPAKQVVKIAFIFDGPSNANNYFLEQFKKSIQKTMDSDTQAVFPSNLVFVGNWTEAGAKTVSNNALVSNANVVVSLGYLSSKYLSELKNKKKYVITIDQYGLRDLGAGTFSPVAQLVSDIALFKRITYFNRVAILMNDKYYATQKNWNAVLDSKLKTKGIDYVVVPVSSNVEASIAKIPANCDAAFILPLLNLDLKQLENLFAQLNNKKIKTFSALGESDVQRGCLLGSGAIDLDRKITEATSFNIKNVLNGGKQKFEKPLFFEDEILYINIDTAEMVGYEPHLRLLNNAKVITNKELPKYSLSDIFNKLDEQNLTIEQKSQLVKAARKAALSAKLKYLPTVSATLGYQQYDEDYAYTASLLIPEKTGVFGLSANQVIYSPALVTNILIKNRKVDFQKAEYFATEQDMGINIALAYIDTLILENRLAIEQEFVKEARENLAIARVREKMGICGKEEVMRWATQLNVTEQEHLEMKADYQNVKLMIAQLLNEPQNKDFKLVPLTAHDPAFYTKDLNILDYVRTPNALEDFTKMLVEESFEVSPELEKLRVAIKMKDHERAMYVQKFILPDAKVSFDYQNLINRQYGKDKIALGPINVPLSALHSDPASWKFGIYAKWTPIEGGTKIAEIQRINAEQQELKEHSQAVKNKLEEHIRSVVNKALACYFSIEKDYKATYAAQENYQKVKKDYLRGKVGIAQMMDAQNTYFEAKTRAANSQNEFFKQLVWVQRGICAVNWTKASPEAKKWIEEVKTKLEAKQDIVL